MEECGQLFVMLREFVFDPLEVFDHCAQLVDTLKMAGLKVTALMLYTDGGPSHSLKRVPTRCSLPATATMLNVDCLIVVYCAPGRPAMNKVERGMSMLNLPLAYVAIMMGDMASCVENATKGANSMAMMCTTAAKLNKT